MTNTHTLKLTLCLVAAVALLSATAPASASQPAECLNVALSASAAPSSLTRCASPALSPANLVAAGSQAFGVELLTVSLNDFTLDAPEFLNFISGAGGPTGSFDATCAFAGSDFSKLYCYDLDVVNNFYSHDIAGGGRTDIGVATPAVGESVTGMAYDNTSGIMYAIGSACGLSSSLYTVNLGTGATTLVGGVHSNGTCQIDIGIDSTGMMLAHDIVTDSIYMVDKATGVQALVGPTGFDANFAQGMACDQSDDICYLFAFNNTAFISELRSINPDGSTNLLGGLGTIVPGGLTEVVGDIAAGGGGGFQIDAIVPGLADMLNTWMISGATPFGTVLGKCRPVGAGSQVSLGSTVADASGNATFDRFMPAPGSGRTIQCAAKDSSSGAITPIFDITFP